MLIPNRFNNIGDKCGILLLISLVLLAYNAEPANSHSGIYNGTFSPPISLSEKIEKLEGFKKSFNFYAADKLTDYLFAGHNREKFLGICSYFKTLKPWCYSKFIYSIPSDREDLLISTADSVKSQFNELQCHFLYHDIGIFLTLHRNLADSFIMCSMIDDCLSGCMHGVAQGYMLKKNGTVSGDELEATRSSAPIKTELIAHGFGHYFYESSENYSIALDKCRIMTQKDPDFMNACVIGLLHERFFYISSQSFENFLKDYWSCNGFGRYKNACISFLGYGYSYQNLWLGDTDFENAKRVNGYCKLLKDDFCSIGVGAGVVFIISQKHKQNPNLSTSLKECIKAMDYINSSSINCNLGYVFFSLLFPNNRNLTDIYHSCKSIGNEENRRACFLYLDYFYNNAASLSPKLNFCYRLEERFRNDCLQEFSKIGYSN
ncbi:hypothetical protein HYX05_04000 [Candidatus Woesearchaeota archaeon]|nr:hypothetical protein [Candidatus Woesearchaeota archaeon]